MSTSKSNTDATKNLTSTGDTKPLKRRNEITERLGDAAHPTLPLPKGSKIDKVETQRLLLQEVHRPNLATVLEHKNRGLPYQLGNFQLVSFLGAGGNGEVYRAIGPGGKEVAVKLLSSADPRAGKRFQREAELLQKLDGNGYPRFVDSNFSSPSWFAMELIEGVTVKEAVEYVGPSNIQTVIRVASQVAKALAYLHNLGYSHRDVKPGNIILGSGQATLIDVGIAKGEKLGEETTTLMGAAAYTAPERFRGESGTSKCDVYGLGLTIFYLSSGKVPFGDKSPDEITGLVLRGELDLNEADPKLQFLIKQMTALDAASRMTMNEVLTTLENLSKGAPQDFNNNLKTSDAKTVSKAAGLTAQRVEAIKAPRIALAKEILKDPQMLADLTSCHLQGFDGAATTLIRIYLRSKGYGYPHLEPTPVVLVREEIWKLQDWKLYEHGRPYAWMANTYNGWKAANQKG